MFLLGTCDINKFLIENVLAADGLVCISGRSLRTQRDQNGLRHPDLPTMTESLKAGVDTAIEDDWPMTKWYGDVDMRQWATIYD